MESQDSRLVLMTAQDIAVVSQQQHALLELCSRVETVGHRLAIQVEIGEYATAKECARQELQNPNHANILEPRQEHVATLVLGQHMTLANALENVCQHRQHHAR